MAAAGAAVRRSRQVWLVSRRGSGADLCVSPNPESCRHIQRSHQAMSPIQVQVARTVVAFSLLVLGAYIVKRRSILGAEDGPHLARLLTQGILPVVIFYQLWRHPLSQQNFVPVVAMVLVGVTSMVLAWTAGRLLRFDRSTIGALMIVSSFGSSALIGYPIIQYAFPQDEHALAQAIVISELGVGLPIFTLCPAVAIYFGELTGKARSPGATAADYFQSPIFVAVVVGLIASRLPVPSTNPFVSTILASLEMVQGALVVLSSLILGLQLDFRPIKRLWALVVISIFIQIFLQAWFAAGLSDLLHLQAGQKQILVLLSSLPSAILGPVFASRYQCAGNIASTLTFVNIIVSPFLVPLVFSLFG